MGYSKALKINFLAVDKFNLTYSLSIKKIKIVCTICFFLYGVSMEYLWSMYGYDTSLTLLKEGTPSKNFLWNCEVLI